MRQIWEKETKLTKEEVHERLEKYFTDNKYINATDEMGVLLCNASMKNRYFQIFYKEGIIRIEGWVKKGKNEQTTSDKKKDILGTDMQAFSRMFSDDGGAERSFEEENGNHAGYAAKAGMGRIDSGNYCRFFGKCKSVVCTECRSGSCSIVLFRKGLTLL